MPEYRIRATGEVTLNLQAAFPNASIPVPPTMADLEVLGVDPVLEAPQPTVTQFQSAYRDGVEEIDGQWFTKWAVADWDEDAIAAATEAQWAAVRADRNKRLAECDWTQLDDTPLSNTQKQEWASYRQALRDLPDVQTDPFNITWPAIPA